MTREPNASEALEWGGFGERIALGPGEIHLWFARHGAMDDAALEARYRTLMNDAERAQERRFYFAKGQRRYLVTRALVRSVLSRYSPAPPEAWTFATNEFGRPEIAGGCDISFNLSHSDGLIVLGIRRGGDLGVDVEDLDRRDAPLDIAGNYFGKLEVAHLTSLPQACRHRRFFEFWTFKESYIKARGMGLSLPLDGFEFAFPDDRSVRIAIRNDLMDDPARWRFWQFEPWPGHMVALCAGRYGQADIPAIRCFEATPLRSERSVALKALRTSD